MHHVKHSIVGDKLYNIRSKLLANASAELNNLLVKFPRQALHAKKLSLLHPFTTQPMSWEIKLPHDMQTLINNLKFHATKLA